MSKRSKADPSASLPSREEVVSFITQAQGKVGKREIAQRFGIKGSDRIWLKQVLKDLEVEGVVDRRGKTVHKAGQLPPVVLADITRRDRDGELIAVPTEWDEEEHGSIPTIIILAPRKPRPGQPVAGVGDRALLKVEPLRPGDIHRYSGRVTKIIAKKQAQVLGIFRSLPEGGGRLIPVDKKAREQELQIRPGDEGEAQDGDLIAVSVVKHGRFGLPTAKVKERLGSIQSEKAVSLIAIHAHSIPNEFPKAVLDEAAAAKPASLEGREDWRSLPLVTIDPPDAKDHDDAVHAVPDDDPSNAGGFIVTVAIADVSAYVRPGSAMDREAQERGNSVYFPDRVVPMLPERISNDLCSLRPREDRPALAVRMVIGPDGRKIRHSFHRVMMRSAEKLSYQQAQAAIDGRPDDVTKPILDTILKPLWAGYELVKKARDIREPLFLDLPERKIVLKPDGTVERVFMPERLEAHKLIEEFMILANVAAAEELERAESDLIYRVHDEPSLEKMRALSEVLASIGLKVPTQGALRPELFNRILRSVEGSEHQLFINEVVLRSQSQAEYAAENYGHFGLNLRRYAHFTSPIRRYADLIVHRALISALKLGKDGLSEGTTRAELVEISAKISAAERRAMAAERETNDRLIAHFLADRIGATFDGQISGVSKAGLFIKLNETGADGFVPAATIGNDYYRYDEATHSMRGEDTGETYRLGDKVEVRLVEAAPVAGALRFELLTKGRFTGKPGGGRKGGKRPARRAKAAAEAGRSSPTRVRVKRRTRA
ncbi:ribonuclease R [Microvirga arsenatis]|uniref:Ribonuclease R n=1 Tax=Microvirga arsenatis TaxID=2692265 RepID=A0ABW9YTR3_9HYPH|nr:ribonuclease R [Microvirga arsenatis]NBJ10139.1 ribonuclease R [Microvirga arsenatis]NBJ23207.1 ribonuclease R [Microvirga arsenatis]